MDRKRLTLCIAAALVAVALWLAWLWQPARQLRLHSATFIGAVERRNWRKVDALLAEKYADRWDHDKGFVLDSLHQALGGFVFLTIEHRVTTLDPVSGRIAEQVKVSGQGNAVAQLVMAKVNALGEPFTFRWRQRSAWPWDWELVEVDHPALEAWTLPEW
jgi:hypothetical protein